MPTALGGLIGTAVAFNPSVSSLLAAVVALEDEDRVTNSE
jgi:hypothetical protein